MSVEDPIRLLPRNAAAQRRSGLVSAPLMPIAGNPASTRLESGVGNCFPGLECDLRNLERRFFPFLEVDLRDNDIEIVSVDLAGVRAARAAGALTAGVAKVYREIAGHVGPGARWRVVTLHGVFGPLGAQTLDIGSLTGPSIGPARLPTDAWTAVRLLTEDSPVQLTVRRGRARRVLEGRRARYLNDDGSLADFFRAGELTQSLCSPWTHDFRDCGCYYWASNHPDIALPPNPVSPSTDVAWDSEVAWERSHRATEVPPGASMLAKATSSDAIELRHHEINHRWQELNFVVEGRELLGAYAPNRPKGPPLPNEAALLAHLRYAAGVELAVMHEYLAAAYSLATRPGAPQHLLDDVDAARWEIMRIAIGEMRHIRAVNDVLRALSPAPFSPALQVATKIPGSVSGGPRPVKPQQARPDVIQEFIAAEAPSTAVDGYYTPILATLEMRHLAPEAQTIRTIMSEGADHWQSFKFIAHWLSRHEPKDYLAPLAASPSRPAKDAYQELQNQYVALLLKLHDGYMLGLPEGAPDINFARASMRDPTEGVGVAAKAVADAGMLVQFEPLTDPRFAPIRMPP
jgi:Ferritin-like